MTDLSGFCAFVGICSGWVSKSSIQPFPKDLTTLTASNKYNQHLIQEALDEAKLVMDVTDETGKCFFDRMCVTTTTVFICIQDIAMYSFCYL